MYCEARNDFINKWGTILPNFRMIPNCPDYCLVYRSPSPHCLSGHDLENFLNLNIKTIIDLRNKGEKESSPSTLINHYSTHEYDRENDCFKLVSKAHTSSNHFPNGKSIYNIDFYSDYFMKKLFSQKELKEDLGDNDPLKLLALHASKKESLLSLYIDYLESDIQVMRAIFRLLSHEEPRRIYPVLIHCSLGKDRTGVVSALIQHCFGHSREAIVEEYALTQKCIENTKGRMLALAKHYGLSEEYIDASEDTMRCLMNYIDEKYGGVSEYFQQNKIKEILQ